MSQSVKSLCIRDVEYSIDASDYQERRHLDCTRSKEQERLNGYIKAHRHLRSGAQVLRKSPLQI